MSFTGLAKHIGVFYDRKGQYVGTTRIEFTYADSYGIKKKTFNYQGGSYNINPKVTRSVTQHFFFDCYIYHYFIDCPDPLNFDFDGVKPLMRPEDYKERLESKLVHDLNKAFDTGLSGLLTWRNLIIVLVAGVIAYYLLSGGQVLPQGNGT